MTTPEPCDHEWEFEDASYDDEFGRVDNTGFVCHKCGEVRGIEPGDIQERDE